MDAVVKHFDHCGICRESPSWFRKKLCPVSCDRVEAQGIVKQRATTLRWRLDCQSLPGGMDKVELDEMADEISIASLCNIEQIGGFVVYVKLFARAIGPVFLASTKNELHCLIQLLQ